MNLWKLTPICHSIGRRLSDKQHPAASFKETELKFTKKFTQKDLDSFSILTGDYNYVHTVAVTEEKRKVHGALLNAIVAGVIGTQFPGNGSIVLEQTLSFPKPCRIEVDCEFVLKLQQLRKISVITYECKQNNYVVFKGQAKILTTNKK